MSQTVYFPSEEQTLAAEYQPSMKRLYLAIYDTGLDYLGHSIILSQPRAKELLAYLKAHLEEVKEK